LFLMIYLLNIAIGDMFCLIFSIKIIIREFLATGFFQRQKTNKNQDFIHCYACKIR